uniref:ZP domain-containing protein n=1 Tax=Steinernema glaseri TaxID=37863 RepID=A0A1I7YTS4_9BILA
MHPSILLAALAFALASGQPSSSTLGFHPSLSFGHLFFAPMKKDFESVVEEPGPPQMDAVTLDCASGAQVLVSNWEWEGCIFSQSNFDSLMRHHFSRPMCIHRFCTESSAPHFLAPPHPKPFSFF